MTETTDWSRDDGMSEEDDYGAHVGSLIIVFKLNLVVPMPLDLVYGSSLCK